MNKCLFKMCRFVISFFIQNSYFVSTFTLGICLSIFITPYLPRKDCVNFGSVIEKSHFNSVFQNIDIYEPKINLAAKPKSALKAGHGMIRPRFHKAELGIRNKLFMGILTTSDSISTLAVALNKTASKYIDKIMFFIDAQSAQRLNVSSLKLPGIVGFTDTKKVLKPFHLIKYVSDNFLEDYDFFFIMKDSGYIQAHRLFEFARKISINNDVHVGRIVENKGETNKICSLDFGIFLSNSVVRKTQKSLEWCVKNSIFKDDNTNIGQCIIEAAQVQCSEYVQGEKFETFTMGKTSAVPLVPTDPTSLKQFNKAMVIAPLTKPEHYYHIHLYFSVQNVVNIEEEIRKIQLSELKSVTEATQVGTKKVWPTSSQPPAPALTHFDVLRWEHFTLTHKYLSDDFSNITPLSGPDKADIQEIVSKGTSFIEGNYQGALKYHGFVNGYRKCDPSRGLDYIIDLSFRETTSGKTVHKRLELFKPLGKVEMVPVPYVTENIRIHLIIPVKSSDIERITSFLKQYSINAMEKKDLQFLMLVFIYSTHESSKGNEDIFKEVKNKALSLSNKFEKAGSLIKWHSIRLPGNASDVLTLTEPLLEFVILDFVLKKFSLESLILMGRPNMEVRLDYFNRVRMNTVSGFQIFSPIPFAEYHPDIIYNENHPQQPELEINKNYGHYDSSNFKHISFYAVDYLKVRKKIDNIIPIVRYDKDILRLVPGQGSNSTQAYSVFSMFVGTSEVHVLRAVEPSLRLRHPLESCSPPFCTTTAEINNFCTTMQGFNLATRAQLGRLILDQLAEN